MKPMKSTGKQADQATIDKTVAQIRAQVDRERKNPAAADHAWEKTLPEMTDDPDVTRAEM